MDEELKLPETIRVDLVNKELPSSNFVSVVSKRIQREIHLKKDNSERKKRILITLGILFLTSIAFLVAAYHLPQNDGFVPADDYKSVPYIGLLSISIAFIAGKLFSKRQSLKQNQET